MKCWPPYCARRLHKPHEVWTRLHSRKDYQKEEMDMILPTGAMENVRGEFARQTNTADMPLCNDVLDHASQLVVVR